MSRSVRENSPSRKQAKITSAQGTDKKARACDGPSESGPHVWPAEPPTKKKAACTSQQREGEHRADCEIRRPVRIVEGEREDQWSENSAKEHADHAGGESYHDRQKRPLE